MTPDITMDLDRRTALELLGLVGHPTESEIRAAFRHLAMDAHPDLGGEHLAMIELRWARDTLLGDASSGRQAPVTEARTARTVISDEAEPVPTLAGVLWLVVPIGAAPLLIVLVLALLLG